MITKTSLKHPTVLKNLKEAILDSVRRASVEPSGVYITPVFNSSGKVIMLATGIKNRNFKVQDAEYRDITDIVKEALKEYHENI